MKTTKQVMNKLTDWLGQEEYLPQSIRQRLDKIVNSEQLLLYAVVDLNSDFKLQEGWVLLTENHLLYFDHREDVSYQKIALDEIQEVRESLNVSSHKLEIMGNLQQAPLLTLLYSHRQKILMGHIKYALERLMKNRDYRFGVDWNADETYQKSILKPVEEAQSRVDGSDHKVLLRLLSYLRPYKRQVGWGMFGAICATLFGLMPAYISGYLIDHVVRPFQDGKVSSEESFQIVWIFVLAIGTIYLVREFFIWLRLQKMAVIGEFVARDLRQDLYSHLQTLGMDFYSSRPSGSIISRVSADTDRIWDFIAFGIVEVTIALIQLIGLGIVLMSLDLTLGLVMVLPVPIFLLAIFWHGETMKNLFLRGWRKWSAVTEVLADTIPGIQVVKAFNQQSKEVSRFDMRNEIVAKEFNNIHYSWSNFWPKLMLGIHLVTVAVWCLAVPRLLSSEGGEQHLTAGTFVSFLLYMTMFVQPLEIIGQMSRMLNRATSSAYRIFEILDTKALIEEQAGGLELKPVKGQVEFKHVNFSYDGIRRILKDVSFKVRAGEMVGLVGPSGGGKSTLTKLLARFFEPSSGQIFIDGVPLKDLNLGAFRKQVGMVLQEPYLFHGTLLENIRYASPQANLDEVIEAAKLANAHQFILKLPYGYDTVIGERGHTLSGGERQRISIARAVLANPRILVLDEATSAVDTETERKIQEALDRLVKGRTVFAIAHRLSTLRNADRIFVIEDGRLKERGTHEELLVLENGIYKKLLEMQLEAPQVLKV